MPPKTPAHVDHFQDRHGHWRTYFRRGKGPRIKLPALGTAEFEAAYAEALAGNPKQPKTPKGRPAAGTIAALIVSYRKSASYTATRETTRKGYASRLAHLEEKHGHRTVAGLSRERIETKILAPFADRPGAAHSILKMLRVLIRHAIATNVLKSDPSLGIKRPKLGEIRSWSDAEILQFEEHWPVGTRERLAFALHLYTGQRRSDIHRMTWRAITDAGIRVVQQKTGKGLTIPVHPDLAPILATATRAHVAILTTAYGETFTVDGFSGFMRDAIRAAGLPIDCRPHGLRKAAGRRLAEAGCSAHEIMAVLGHETLAEAERYTRAAEQTRLARAAFSKLTSDRTANKITQPNPEKFGKTASNANEINMPIGRLALPRGLEPLFSP